MYVSDFEIKGYWLEKVIQTGLGVFGYTLGGLGVSLNSVKLLFLLSMFIVLNAVVLYHSTIMFAASILYMMKTCNKIYTKFLINKENVYILGLQFEHKLTEAEKKEILDAIFTSKITVHDVNDTNLYDGLYQMVMELNDKQAIQELVTNKIATYTMEMEKRADSFRSLQLEKSYDYIQEGLDGIWSYMTPNNVLFVISIIGLGITMFWIYNGVIGSENKMVELELQNQEIIAQNVEIIAQNVEIIKQHSESTLQMDDIQKLQDLIKSNELQLETLADYVKTKCVEFDNFNSTSIDVFEEITQTSNDVVLHTKEILAQNAEIIKQHSELTLQMDDINKLQDLIKRNDSTLKTLADYVKTKCAEYDDFNSSTISLLSTVTSFKKT